ncbi:NAD(P)H-dependent oxidoreductase [soil metagenome]
MSAAAKPRHVVILCHPDHDSFNAAVAEQYRSVAEENGQEAIIRDLYRMNFDPVLRSEEQPGSADFCASPEVVQELAILADAAVVVFVYPLWFGSPPAMLKGYVERVLGSGFSFRAVKANDDGSRLAGKHLLSFTTSGNSQIWLDEVGEWQSLIQIFDRYLERAFSMVSTEHVHFSSIVDGLSDRFFLQYMEEVRQAARKSCSIVADEHYRKQT